MLAVDNNSNRRRYPRVTPSKDHPVRVDINGQNFIEILNASDISEDGISLNVPHGFEGCALDELVSFAIELPAEPKNIFVKAKGKIRHISGDQFGVHFVHITESARQELQKYIADKIKEESFIGWVKYKAGLF